MIVFDDCWIENTQSRVYYGIAAIEQGFTNNERRRPLFTQEHFMSLDGLLIWLIVGGLAGLIASQIMNSGGLRLTGNHIVDTIITGIIGALLGGFLLGALGVSFGGGLIGSIVSAVIGAVVFIFGLRLINR
jgi:uncharacterized membrane protein YeaQ/YmgE (transglycosylase-associated protein family)